LTDTAAAVPSSSHATMELPEFPGLAQSFPTTPSQAWTFPPRSADSSSTVNSTSDQTRPVLPAPLRLTSCEQREGGLPS
ncbi:MAG: hypothetical protein ACKOFW_01290, partial [Planctomycetaceae bacterium]